MSELLYTQEDIDEWIRTCNELQDIIYEQKVEIAQLVEERENMQDEIFALEDARLQAIKDTAREIYLLLTCVPEDDRHYWRNAYNDRINKYKLEIKERYGVEVE